MKKVILFYLIFFGLSSTSYFILTYEKDQKIKEYLDIKTKQYTQNYDALYHEYKQLSEVIFKTKINTKEVLDIFKNRDRDKLYSHLKDTYSLLKQDHTLRLHFYLPNNDSFLRFHRPKKYGDNLTNTRETIKYVNETKKQIDGFEEGRIFGAYRFVFPLFYEKEYIGSMDISIRTLSLNMKFTKNYKVVSNFLILKDVINKKVFKKDKKNYIQSPFNQFLMEKEMFKKISKRKNIIAMVPVSNETMRLMTKEALSDKSFSTYDSNKRDIMTFIKVQNPITKKTVGLFVVRSEANYIHNSTKHFYKTLLLLIVFIALVLFFIYKEIKFKDYIKQNNKKLQTILEEADSGIGLMSLDGRFLEVNRAYCELLGYTKEELLNLNCTDISSENSKKTAMEIIEEAKEKGMISKVRKECISKNGSLVNIEFSLTLLPSQNAFIAVINSLNDKLELENFNSNLHKKIEDAMEKNKLQSQQILQQSRLAQMGEMISMIAHQWRQPLTAISATTSNLNVKLMMGDKIDNDFLKKELNLIGDYSQHLSKTIDDFRGFFKDNKTKEITTLKQIVSGTLDIVQTSVENKNIKIITHFNCNEKLKTYSNEVKQVVLNIIKNAEDILIEKDVENPTITIEVLCDANCSGQTLIIKDNAGGIPEDIIDKIFDPYFSTKKEKDGTGLGLYMSKTIIEEHCGGKISVSNDDEGAVFKIEFIKENIDGQ